MLGWELGREEAGAIGSPGVLSLLGSPTIQARPTSGLPEDLTFTHSDSGSLPVPRTKVQSRSDTKWS